MPWIIGGAVLGGSALGAGASIFGANKQAQSAEQANQLIAQQASNTQGLLQPYNQTGYLAMNQLRGLLGLPSNDGSVAANPNAQLAKSFSLSDFQQSPDYQFNLQQGQMAIDKAANAKGNLYAPQTLQDISKFSQGLASNEFMNAYNMFNQDNNNLFGRLNSLSGAGQSAAAGQGAAGLNAAGMMGNNITSAGAAQAGGIVGAANAINSGLGTAYNAYLMNQIIGNQNASIGFGPNPWGQN